MMEEFVKILETFKWPIVVSILSMISMRMFAPQIKKLIGGIKKIGKDGIETEQAIHQTDPKKILAKDLIKMFDNKLLLETEDWINTEITKISYSTPEEKEKLLIRLYASEKIARLFDRIYNSIFGSQISMLHQLNSFAGTLVEINRIKIFYDHAKEQHSGIYKGYTFEDWLSYLERMVLILRKNNSIGINVRGQEFLKYLIDQGLSINKFG